MKRWDIHWAVPTVARALPMSKATKRRSVKTNATGTVFFPKSVNRIKHVHWSTSLLPGTQTCTLLHLGCRLQILTPAFHGEFLPSQRPARHTPQGQSSKAWRPELLAVLFVRFCRHLHTICNVMYCIVVQCNAMQFNCMVWHGTDRYGMYEYVWVCMSMYEYVWVYIFVQPSWATTWIPQFNPPWRSTAKLSRNTWGKGHLAGKRRPRSAPPPVEIEFPKNFHEIPSNPHWCKLVQLQSNHDTMILLRSMVWFYPSSLCRWLQVPMGSGSSMSVQTKQGWLAIQYPPMGVASL